MKRHHWISIGLAGGIVLATAPLVVLESRWMTLLGRTLQNFGHVPLFGVITLLLLLLASYGFRARPRPLAQYAGVLIVALIVGVLTEFVQMIGPRDADLRDLARNGAGVLAALVWWATFDRRLDGTFIRRAAARIALRVVSVAVALAFLAPLIGVVNAYIDRANRFPVLFSFDASSQKKFMKMRLAAFEFVPAPEAWGVDSPDRVAHVSFSRLKGGAVIFEEPVPDWSAHTALVFELFHPGERPIEFGLRVDDLAKAFHYRDRYNLWFAVEPGINRLRIPLEEIAAGPTERRLDLSSIDRFIFFPVDPVGGYEIYIGPILLE